MLFASDLRILLESVLLLFESMFRTLFISGERRIFPFTLFVSLGREECTSDYRIIDYTGISDLCFFSRDLCYTG